MEIRITADSDAIVGKLEAMLRNLEASHETMATELTAWQEQDMGRARPDTAVPDPHTATTTIWPRGRQLGAMRRRRHQPRLLRRRATSPGGIAQVLTRRPILRPELLTRLRERMVELLGKIAWH